MHTYSHMNIQPTESIKHWFYAHLSDSIWDWLSSKEAQSWRKLIFPFSALARDIFKN